MMKRHPKGMTALCALAVLLCAAAPAVFLAITDSARFGRVGAAAVIHQAACPARDDYYLLNQLAKRDADHSEDTLQKPGYYVSGSSELTSMSPGYSMREETLQALQNLADNGVLPQAWVDVAGDWADESYYTTYNGTYGMNYPYYTLDSLGFLTVTRYTVRDNNPYAVFTLTMDSATGSVVSVWISAPEELETPGPEALAAWMALNGLDTLGDWGQPENTPFRNALYSANGQALATCAVHSYSPLYYTEPDYRRWYISLSLTPCAPQELPRLVPAL